MITRRAIAKTAPKGALALLAVLQEWANAHGYVRLNGATIEAAATELNTDRRKVERWLLDLDLAGAIRRFGPTRNRAAQVVIHRSKRPVAVRACENCTQPVTKNGSTTSNLCPKCKMSGVGRSDRRWMINAVNLKLQGKTVAEIHVALAALGTPRSICGDRESEAASTSHPWRYGIVQLLVEHGLEPPSMLAICRARMSGELEGVD